MIGTMASREEVEGNCGNKGDEAFKMIFIHMGEALQEFQDGSSSSSTPSVMLSMGEDFMDNEGIPHGVL
jgi:hypothetical protein